MGQCVEFDRSWHMASAWQPLLWLGPPVGAQVAPGPNVSPRTVWSEPPEQFTTRVVATGFEDPYEVAWGPDG